MAKKLYAVTNIKVATDKTFEAGSEIDPAEMKEHLNKDQIKSLVDAGAIEMKDDDSMEPLEEGTTVEETGTTEEPEASEETPTEVDTGEGEGSLGEEGDAA